MLYMTAFRLSSSAREILMTMRLSLLGPQSVPCHVPVKFWASKACPDNDVRTMIPSGSNFFMLFKLFKLFIGGTSRENDERAEVLQQLRTGKPSGRDVT
jgi:hypothetical protein